MKYTVEESLIGIQWFKYKTMFDHREDGPAIHWKLSNTQVYCLNDRIHRIDGPAITDDNGRSEYWLYGIPYWDIRDNQEWFRHQKLLAFS